MIWAKLSDWTDYRGIHPRLDRVLELLTPDFFEALSRTRERVARPEAVTGEGDLQQPPRIDLEGEALYVTRFEYETLPREETYFEAHRSYLDVHVVLSGRERVEIADPGSLAEFTHEGDFWGYHGEAEQQVLLTPGHFLVVFPGDAHRLKIAVDQPGEPVVKVVFKVLIP